jgi:predicted flap endonuclease-1-like 5' DNA nuclease
VYSTANGTSWLASSEVEKPGLWGGFQLIGDTLFFAADNDSHYGPGGSNLWAHGISNNTTWGIAHENGADPFLKQIHWGVYSNGGLFQTIDTALYFTAVNQVGWDSSEKVWIYETTNETLWKPDGFDENVGATGAILLVDDILYYDSTGDGIGTNGVDDGQEMWAFNSSNGTNWMLADINTIHTSADALSMQGYVGISMIDGVLYFRADDGSNGTELWAYGVGNVTIGASGPESGPVANATCEISPALSAGITLTQGTCTISGTPTATQSSTVYTLWVNQSGVSDTATIDITVQEMLPDPPSISPASISVVLTNTTAMTPISFSNSGGAVDSWEVNPALPDGLSITSGTISGTPTTVQTAGVYDIWANNSGGSDYAIVTITINELLSDQPSISPASISVVLTNTTAMSPIEFTNSGGVIDTWDVYPSLPSGLTFETSNGTISGTPTTVQTAADYTVWANNTGGADSSTVTITVEEYIPDPPEISYSSSVVLIQYSQMIPIVPTNTGGVADTWEISPALSPGLILDSADGVISGTPTTVESGIVYTIWANNTGGSDSATQIITVEIAPDGLSTSSPSILLVRDGTMLPWYFNYNGDNITTWEISPDLPPGLIFDIASKSIFGTPTEMMAATTFTIWANGSGISESINVTIEVLEDTDGDGMPDSLGSHTNTGLIEDLDDDADGISDVDEFVSIPATNSILPDTDGDGICDGLINVTIRDVQICEGGPDAFPTDPSAWEDTDGDGEPDNIEGNSTSEPPLVEDLDDDGDGIPDEDENAEGSLTDSLLPDTDGDGVCDGSIDVTYDDELICTGGPDAFPDDPTEWVDTDDDKIGNNADLDDDGDQASDEDENAAGTDPLDPLDFPTDDADGDGWTDAQEDFCGTDKLDNTSIPADNEPDGWCDSDDPDDDNDGWFDTTENDCDSDPLDDTSIPADTDGDGICDKLDSEPQDDNDDGGFQWWLCSLLFLALIIILPLIMRLIDDAMPENTRVRPEVSGVGTREDPFILTPTGGIEPGESVLSEETITITNMTPELKVHIIDLKEKENGRKFLMVDEVQSDNRVTMIVATEDGTMDFRMSFSDSFNPTPGGGSFQSTLKVGRNSVYFMWDVTVKSDPNYVKSAVKTSSSDTTVVSLQLDSEEDEKPAKKAAAKAKAKKADAKVKAKKADAKVKAKKAAEADVPLTKEEKKAAGLERVKANAAKIDFGTIGVATMSERDDLKVVKGIGPFIEEKLNTLGIYTFQQISKMTGELEEQVNEAIEFFPGRVKRDQWVNQCKTLLNDE